MSYINTQSEQSIGGFTIDDNVYSKQWMETSPNITTSGNLVLSSTEGDVTITPQILKRLIEMVQREFPEDNL